METTSPSFCHTPTIRTLFVVLVNFLACWVSSTGTGREWTDSSGTFRVQAELVDASGDLVRLRKPDGSLVTVPLERLSVVDQQYVRTQQRSLAQQNRIAEEVKTSADGMLDALNQLYDKHRSQLEDYKRGRADGRQSKGAQEYVRFRGEERDINMIDEIVNFGNLHHQIQRDIEARRQAVRSLIAETADKIYRNVDFELKADAKGISISVLESADIVVTRRIEASNRSVNSLLLAMQLLAKVTQTFGEEITKEKDPQKQFEKYIDHTVIVYELTSGMRAFIAEFEHRGAEDLVKTSDERLRTLALRRKEHTAEVEKLRASLASAPDADKGPIERRIQRYEILTKLLGPAEDVWKAIKVNVQDKEETIAELKSKEKALRENGDDCLAILRVLSEVKVARNVKDLLASTLDTADLIIDLPLYVPSERAIRLYLGIEDRKVDGVVPGDATRAGTPARP